MTVFQLTLGTVYGMQPKWACTCDHVSVFMLAADPGIFFKGGSRSISNDYCACEILTNNW